MNIWELILGGTIAVTLGSLLSDYIIAMAVRYVYNKKSKDIEGRLAMMEKLARG